MKRSLLELKKPTLLSLAFKLASLFTRYSTTERKPHEAAK